MYDQYARRAALDSSPDEDQHELLTSVRFLVHNRTRLSTLKMNSSSRASSSTRLARAHERGRHRGADESPLLQVELDNLLQHLTELRGCGEGWANGL